MNPALPMQLLAVNLAKKQELQYEGRKVFTGIYKNPTDEVVQVYKNGLLGDVQVDRQNHGGPDKAIYAYTVENYQYWKKVLKRDDLGYGFFGENFTMSALPDEAVHIGDIFQIGSIQAQVTQPRIPCFKLGAKLGAASFVRAFLRSGRVGFYLRVLEEGKVQAGSRVMRISIGPGRLSIRECMLIHGNGPESESIMRRAVELKALSGAWRADLAKRIDSL